LSVIKGLWTGTSEAEIHEHALLVLVSLRRLALTA
jgi:hypothetical protein